MNSLSFFSISCFLTAFLSLIMGVFIYSRNKKELLNQIWAVMSLAVFLWSFSLFMVVNASKENVALFWQYVLDISAIFIPVLFFHFTLIFLKPSLEKKDKIQLRTVYCLSIALALFSFTPLFKIGVASVFEFNFWIKPGSFYILFPLFFLGLVIYSSYLFVKKYFQAQGITKLQIKYILLATLFGFGGGATNFFPQLVKLLPIGNYFVALYILIIIFAITRYHLFEIRVILTEILVGVMGLLWLIFLFLMPTLQLKGLAFLAFLLFCLFAYYLVKATHEESKRREEAEKIAAQERALREETEKIAQRETETRKKEAEMREKAEKLALRERQLKEEIGKVALQQKRLAEVHQEVAEERTRRMERIYYQLAQKELEIVELKKRISELEEELKRSKKNKKGGLYFRLYS